MLKSPSTAASSEQLLTAFLLSFKLFLVALSFLGLFILLFVRAALLFIGAWLAVGNALCNAAIDLMSLYSGTRDFCAFLAR